MQHCWACHGGPAQEAGLDLRTHSSIRKGGKSGPAVVPGRPEESPLFVRARDGLCPPNRRLVEANVKPVPDTSLARLRDWIAEGAPEEKVPEDVAGRHFDPHVSNKDREFWAFRPLRRVPVPQVPVPGGYQNPVDRFISARLNAVGLEMTREAPARALIRRVYFDLIGLPPSPGEVEVFMRDQSPGAYERLVDRLLASPQYGERWARHWLDVAGYSDVEGKREQHLPRPHNHRYRDYVIRSLNEDKPYDRFLLEQIAGDELADVESAPEVTRELEDNLVATGFLRQAPDPTWANITGFVPDRLDVIGDSLTVLGGGVMGLTLACARCHDHKFDPLPQRDYYRLADVFKGAWDEYDWMKPGLTAFGGAGNSGPLKERTLPWVTSRDRRDWEAQRDRMLAGSGGASVTNRAVPASDVPAEPRIAALWDRGNPSPTYILLRGDPERFGPRVKAGPPAVLCDPDKPWEPTPPWAGSAKTGRRLAFARWLTTPENPLTARVMVNRVWKHHFGRGIVKTLDNFGRTGAVPTHPELLDQLSAEFISSGWRLKSLHRLLVTSATYRQSSIAQEPTVAKDPENTLWSRMPMRRLDAESLWDACLSVAGALDETRFGPAVPVESRKDGTISAGRTGGRWRRSIYGQQNRKEIPTLLESFDLSAMNPNCIVRTESNVPTQALNLLNDSVIRELAERFAQRIRHEAGESLEARIRRAFLIAFGRDPSSEEMSSARRMFDAGPRQNLGLMDPGIDEGSLRSAAFCRALINSAEFLYVD